MFHQDKVVQYALLKALENIGEAARQISRSTRTEFDSLEWDKMISVRHVYVHEYFQIDRIKLWQSINTIDFTGMIKSA